MKDYEEEFYEEEEERDEEPRRGWTEEYLNTLGMSLRDFL